MYSKFLTKQFPAFSHVWAIPLSTNSKTKPPIVSALPFRDVNTPPHQNPRHPTHSSMEINLQNFAGYFSEFPTLINVRERMASKTTHQPIESSRLGRLSRPTYCQMGRSCPENSAKHPKSAAKLNVLTTLRLKSNRNSSLQDPLPRMPLSIRTLPNLFFLDDVQP